MFINHKKIILFVLIISFLNFNIISQSNNKGERNYFDSELRSKFIECAKNYLGTPYQIGGTTKKGIDCSGLIYAAAKDSGLPEIPRTAIALYENTRNTATLIEGDLLFFGENNIVSHVGIYLGNQKYIHSASEGKKTGVIISRLDDNGALAKSFICHKSFFMDNEATENKNISHFQFKNFFNESFNFEAAATIDWSFIKPDDIGLFFKGVTFEGQIQINRWKINPGLMGRMKIFGNKNGGIGVLFPIALTLTYDERYQLYFGMTGYIQGWSTPVLYNSSITLQPQLFPGILGASITIPLFDSNGYKICLYQDINYLFIQSSSKTLSNQQLMSGGFNLATGIKVKF